ncbi:MAG: putative peroxygenase 4-like [Elusimicrobia bacterium]|nr:MAG: putative peroxygenase 4-like [Elusimicrobiota bacterium]
MNLSLLAAVLLTPAFAQPVGLETAQPTAAGLLLAVPKAAPSAAPVDPTALQKHVAFFDMDGNGLVTRFETTLSLRRLGMSNVKATAAALVIHVALGPATTGRWGSLDVSVANIKLGKHGSDTGAYDAEGRFVPEAFERMFAEFDVNRSGSLSEAELLAMTAANSRLRPGGESASKVEFQLLLLLAGDASEAAGGGTVPALSRARLQDFYDGSLFYKLAK